MLQSRLTFSTLFKRGISPLGINKKNQNFFSTLINFKPTENGLETINKNSFSYVVKNDLDSQVFEIGTNSYLFTKTEIYKIENDGSLSFRFSGIASGGRWFCADYQIYAIFSNGVRTIILDNTGTFSYTNVIPQVDILLNYNGQLLMGGLSLDYNNFVSSCFTTSAIGKTFIAWSGIGDINCIPSDSNVLAGYRSMMELGEVYGIYKIGKTPIVLCSKGCSELVSFENGYGSHGITDMGPRDIYSHAGNDKVCAFINRDGNVVRIKDKIEILGYKDLFKDVSTKMFFKSSTEEFFILTATDTYVLAPFGMYEVSGVFLGAIERTNSNRFIVSSIPNLDDGYFVTTPFDFRDPGLKIIEEISLGIDTQEEDEDLSVCVYSKEKINGPWNMSPYFSFNDQNVTKPHIAGSAFKFGFKHKGFNFSAPEYITIQYDKIDKRFNRGHAFVDPNSEG